MWHLVAVILASILAQRIRCSNCGARQRLTKTSALGAVRILCWQCQRTFTL
jgi:hypothetical protein